MRFIDQPIFVSGATGFIGGRVCERLVQAGARDVRALVHNVQHASRLARLPIQLRIGDLLNANSLRDIVGDAKVVIHLGLGYGRGIVRGTRNLLQAAQASDVQRFVHISTTAVFGLRTPPGCETEDAPIRFTGDQYCDNKSRAERVVEKFAAGGLPTVTLRPSIVYGPYSRWCIKTVENLCQERVALIDGGEGVCNTTYVDNLVDAIFLALENDSAVGQTFTITDAEMVTWGDFVRAHASMLAHAMTIPEVSSEAVLAFHRAKPGLLKASTKETARIIAGPEFRELIKRIPLGDRFITWAWYRMQNLDDKAKDRLRIWRSEISSAAAKNQNGTPFPDLVTWQIQSSKVSFSISKARTLLGYEPRVPFAKGIRLTEEWLRFANYL
jgi:nucleoside-diphosphate-sugar epimerase